MLIRFSELPNLAGGSVRCGHKRHPLAVCVDKKPAGREVVTQACGSTDLIFAEDSGVISALSSRDSLAVAVPWYGQGSVAFVWSLHGSSVAIRASC